MDSDSIFIKNGLMAGSHCKTTQFPAICQYHEEVILYTGVALEC